jgi:hypothetical protein
VCCSPAPLPLLDQALDSQRAGAAEDESGQTRDVQQGGFVTRRAEVRAGRGDADGSMELNAIRPTCGRVCRITCLHAGCRTRRGRSEFLRALIPLGNIARGWLI